MSRQWSLPFLEPLAGRGQTQGRHALIILNQPFSFPLFKQLWTSCQWRCCADGGANRLHDLLISIGGAAITQCDLRKEYLPDLIKGDLDSLRDDVRQYYASQGVVIVQDHDQNSTDLMKCVDSLTNKERSESTAYDVVILGGLSGRLDQTIHTLSYLHKLRKQRERVYAVTDENIGWVLDQGEHQIHVNQTYLGNTCGLLPVGIDSTIITTKGLRWDLTEHKSHFDGMVSTSNHLVPGEDIVYVKTIKPIWWTVELRSEVLALL